MRNMRKSIRFFNRFTKPQKYFFLVRKFHKIMYLKSGQKNERNFTIFNSNNWIRYFYDFWGGKFDILSFIVDVQAYVFMICTWNAIKMKFYVSQYFPVLLSVSSLTSFKYIYDMVEFSIFHLFFHFLFWRPENFMEIYFWVNYEWFEELEYFWWEV